MKSSVEQARTFFRRLPAHLRIATLSPDYVLADSWRDPSLRPFFWIDKYNETEWMIAGHVSLIPGTDDWYDFQSAYGYGGPLFINYDENNAQHLWKRYTSWCKSHNIVLEFIRFHPLARNHMTYIGKTMYMRETVWIDLSVRDLYANYKKKLRWEIRNFERNYSGCTILNKSRFLDKFPPLYNSAMERKHSNEYIYPASYFSELLSLCPSLCLGCIPDDAMQAGSIFLIGDEIMEYHLSAREKKAKSGVSAFLIHVAAAWGAENGLQKLYLGGGLTNDPHDTLYSFKKKFSPYRAPYYIGFHIHDHEKYGHIENIHQAKRKKNAGRILFYR